MSARWYWWNWMLWFSVADTTLIGTVTLTELSLAYSQVRGLFC